MEALGFPIHYYAPLVFDSIKINGDPTDLYDSLSNDLIGREDQIELHDLIGMYDTISRILRDYIFLRPHLHRLLTADVYEVTLCELTRSWLVRYHDDDSSVDIAKRYMCEVNLRHLGGP